MGKAIWAACSAAGATVALSLGLSRLHTAPSDRLAFLGKGTVGDAGAGSAAAATGGGRDEVVGESASGSPHPSALGISHVVGNEG